MVKLLSSSISTSSQKTYKHSFNLYKRFHIKYYGNISQYFPISVSMLANFIAYLTQQGYAPSSIQTNVSGICYLNSRAGFPNPSKNVIIKNILKGSKNLNPTTDKRLPVTPKILKKFLVALKYMSLNHYYLILYKAMFLLAFYAFLRVGEYTCRGKSSKNVISFHNVTMYKTRNKVSRITIHLDHFKHSKQSVTLSLKSSSSKLCPVRALHAYLKLRGKRPGPLFLDLYRCPVQTIDFSKILKRVVIFSGLSANFYKPHSFRIGATTWAHSLNMSDSKIQSLGRWHSSAFKKYIRVPLIPAI